MSAVAHRSRLEEMCVADAMSEGVLSLPRNAPLSEVAQLMAEREIHCVVISDYPGDGAEVWGVVSDLDLVAAATVRGLEDQTAGGSAATTVMGILPEDTLLRAGQLMTENAVTHLVVVAPDTGAPRGVLSTLDIAAALANHPHRKETVCSD
jgi:CBS domain-containing protein